MVNLFVSVILAGFATTFTIEFLSLALSMVMNKETVYTLLVLPLSFGAIWFLQDFSRIYTVLVPAAAFVCLLINKYINKPVVYNYSRSSIPRI